MRTYQACIPCIINLMESTLNKADLDDLKKQVILDKFNEDYGKVDMTLPPARTAGLIYQKLLQETAQEDLFKAHKKSSIQEALKLYPQLKNLAEGASDSLEMAIRISALGNILDVSNPNNYNLEDEIIRLMDVQIVGGSLELFRNKLSSADSLLILADNAGEAVFDKVLIETIDVPTVYAVKSKPAFDDALLADARQAGIDQVAQIIETGTPYPGTYMPSCTPEFQDIFTKAPLVLAKGQANFETLSDASRDLFFLLKVKCEVVSEEINFPIGSLTLKYHQD